MPTLLALEAASRTLIRAELPRRALVFVQGVRESAVEIPPRDEGSMNRSIRCRHGFDRDLVDCPACGDKGSLERHEQRLVDGHRRRYHQRKQVINKPHGRPSNQGTR